MKTTIYYYTGTGNSLWTARLVAKQLGDTTLYPMSKVNCSTATDADAIGLVFPVHIWGVPSLVLDFLEKLEKDTGKYYFAFAVNAGQVSSTLIQLQNHIRSQGLTLAIGVDIALPSNYIPWGGPGSVEKQEKMHREASQKIKQVVPRIAEQETAPMEMGPLWQRLLFTALYKATFNMVPKMDKDFWVDERCNSCGICEKTCPVGNIVMTAEKPSWLHKCEQCLACLQWCPTESVQYGKKTPRYERYQHPEVSLKDIIG